MQNAPIAVTTGPLRSMQRSALQSPLRRGPLAAIAVIALVLVTETATAQQSGAVLVTTVRMAANGAPLQGAQVVVEGVGTGGVTDATGVLRLEGLKPGMLRVSVRYLGYAEESQAVHLTAEGQATLSFALRPQSIPLAEVRVRAPVGQRRLAALGFYDRKANGPGSFLTRSDIEKRNPGRLSDMLRVMPGLHLAATPYSDSRASMLRATPNRRCPIQYYVDGVTTVGFNIDDVQPGDVDAIEVYRGASQIPASFNRGTALCGVIVIWTRIGRG